jgi:hypothetical protein
VIGAGLNALELEANPRLDRHWLQNLNLDQRLPLESGSVDAALLVAFSNGMLFQMASRIWTDGADGDRLHLVAQHDPVEPSPTFNSSSY